MGLPDGWKGFLLAFLDDFDGEPGDEAAFREIVEQLAALEAKLSDLAQEVLVVGNGGTISEIGERFRVLHAKAIAALEEGGDG